MSCSTAIDSTRPATIVHLMTRHQARKYVVAARGEPEIISPNSHTQPSISAIEPAKIRI